MQENVPVMEGQQEAVAQPEGGAQMNIGQNPDDFVNPQVNQNISDNPVGDAVNGAKPEFGPMASKILAPSLTGIHRAPNANASAIP